MTNKTFTTAVIDKAFYISHEEIARFVFACKLEEEGKAGTTKVQRQQILEQLTADIKASLIEITTIPEKLPESSIRKSAQDMVVRRGFLAFANKDAFYALAQVYDWSENISQPILASLGEWGLELAHQTQQEMHDKQVVAA